MTAATNAGEVARDLQALGVRAGQRAAAVTRHYGAVLQARVKARASGRPGPRAQTGDYRRSIALQVAVAPTGISATVATNKPQARRLEYGFHGTDSLGRTYSQPPLPHFGPAFQETEREFTQALGEIL